MQDETVPAPAEPSEATPAPAEEVKQDVQKETEEPKPDAPKEPRWYRQAITARDRQIGALKGEAQRLQDQLARFQSQASDSSTEGESKIDPRELAQRVELEAEKKASQRLFDAKCNAIWEEGRKKHANEFEAAVHNLQTAVPDYNEKFGDLVESDDPVKLMHYLGNNLDEAAEILALPDKQRAKALAKLELKLEQQTKPAASNAPKPLSPLKPTSAAAEPDADKDPASWIAYRNRMERARA